MKKPVAILITDIHLDKNNLVHVKEIIGQVITKAVELNCSTVIGLGDFFKSRKAQPLHVLNGFGEVLSMFQESKIDLTAIPGNHDKVDYESEKSYLDEFKFHPNFKLIDKTDLICLDNLVLHLIPYFKEDTVYLNYLKQVKVDKTRINILGTHISFDGVKNNDKNLVSNKIKGELFKKFHSCFVGHYHDQSFVGNNVYYIGSTDQRCFNEDTSKGMTVLYSDGSHEFVKLSFQEYRKIEVDIDKTDLKAIDGLLKQYSGSEKKTRFEFIGDSSRLKAINTTKINEAGIDVKMKPSDVQTNIDSAKGQEFVSFDKKAIKEGFKEFCELNKVDYEIGQKYLSEIL